MRKIEYDLKEETMKKSAFYPLIVGVQVIFFVFIFLYGKKGWLELEKLKREVGSIAQQAIDRSHEIEQITSTINEWANNTFYKEKIAREQLHMARRNDEIFYLQ